MPQTAPRAADRTQLLRGRTALVVAPFERGASFGGSQRATTLAERLEERGMAVQWATLAPHVPGRARRLLGTLSPEPGLVRYARAAGELPDGRWDAVIAAHSYMAVQLEGAPPGAVRAIDFHNLEWRHLDDTARGAGGLRSLHLRSQAARMRRFEARAVASAPLAMFTSPEELGWADAVGGPGIRLLVRNLLPRREVELASEIWRARRGGVDESLLVYVGKLTFPPNEFALGRFLDRAWPSIRQAAPRARLRVIGAIPDAARERFAAHPGVEVLGFVDDLAAHVSRAAAAVMPIEGTAGTSLRTLLFALSGVPVVGSPAAFRDARFDEVLEARSPADWAEAVRACLDGGAGSTERARDAALSLHADPAPWDALAEVLA